MLKPLMFTKSDYTDFFSAIVLLNNSHAVPQLKRPPASNGLCSSSSVEGRVKVVVYQNYGFRMVLVYCVPGPAIQILRGP